MSLSTRRPPGGLPSSVRAPRSSSSVRGREPLSHTQDDVYTSSSSENRFRSQRSRSVPRKESSSDRVSEAPPLPSTPSRHSVQSSTSSSSTGASSVSTAPSSIWEYVSWKGNASFANEHEEKVPSPEPVESHPDNGLWSRVAAAAGGLSINVGKAWEAKDDLLEPDTPPGHDSRVTVALKKHYIKQVSDPRQLPSWLFSDIERQVGRNTRRESEDGPPYGDTNEPTPPAPSRSRARHGDAYAQSQTAPTKERARTATYDEEYRGPTRAATRLRAMRDARRGPVADGEVYAPAVPEPGPEPEPLVVVPLPRPRVGLPSRPTRPRRE